MRHIQLLLRIYLIIKCLVISIIPAMIVIHQSTHMDEKYYQDYNSYASDGGNWDAPVNDNAYTSRNIYHYAEGARGNITGSFVIAKGKYIWTIEEDFTLFIKSISESSSISLLSGIDNKKERKHIGYKKGSYKSTAAYLLAQQYIDATYTLNELITPVKQNNAQIFLYRLNA